MSAVSVWSRSGYRHDPKGREGIAHLYEHLMMKQTNIWKNELDRHIHLEEHGIAANATTSVETAYYYHTQLPEHTNISFDLLQDGIETSKFTDVMLREEKKNVVNEKKETEANQYTRIVSLHNHGLFSNTDIDKNIFGSSSSIRSISLQQIKQFKRKQYSSDKENFVVIVPDIGAMKHVLIPATPSLPKKISKLSRIATIPVVLEKNNSSEALFALGFVTTSIHHWKDTIALHMLRDYFANNWTSKFIQLLRAKHAVTYWVDGETANFSDTGLIRFTWSMQTVQFKKIYPLMIKEIEQVKHIPISERELKRIKTLFISSFTKNMMDIQEKLWFYGYQYVLGAELRSAEDFIVQINAMTTQDLQKAANTYFTPERQSIAAIGRIGKKEIEFVL